MVDAVPDAKPGQTVAWERERKELREALYQRANTAHEMAIVFGGTLHSGRFPDCDWRQCKNALRLSGAEAKQSDLSVAWERADALRPEGWELEVRQSREDFVTAVTRYPYSLRHYRENVGPARSSPFVMAHGPTPAAALNALADQLSKEGDTDANE